MYKEIFSKEELAAIDYLQQKMFETFKSVPESGVKIEYRGMDFFAFKNTFFPFEDSKSIAENMKISKGEKVLDVGTGSGILAILAAKQGGIVTAIDINPDALRTAIYNARMHNFIGKISFIKSDMFEGLKAQKFDAIIANLPFRNKKSKDVVECSMWDTDFMTNRIFFEEVKNFLHQDGRIYLSQANFGEPDEVLEMASKQGFSARLIGNNKMKNDSRVFYAFELTRPSS